MSDRKPDWLAWVSLGVFVALCVGAVAAGWWL
jgi:hypothetical protein